MESSPMSLQAIKQVQVEYRQLGKSGLRVSVPILGMMGMGLSAWMGWVLDEEKAAYDRGVNTWDTANVYSNGVSEKIIGNAITKYEIPRHKLVLMTKCYGYVQEVPERRGTSLVPTTPEKNMANTYGMANHQPSFLYSEEITDSVYQGLSRLAIFNAIKASLQRLKTDYIDLLMIHRFDKTVPIEETMEALHDLVKSGKVRYIGASSMWAHEFALMQFAAEKHNWTKFISMQNYYNLIYREEEREMNKFCDMTGWAPLGRGVLTRSLENNDTARGVSNVSDLTVADKEIISRVGEIAAKKGWPMTHVTLAWLSKRVVSPVIGFSSVQRLDEAVSATGKSLTDDEEAYLQQPYVSKAIRGHM
ncbi:Aldo-keto reductase dtxS3 [Hyphodiscus hymeniophilus]|uniref:Aldo-keto reductase dtxS3 n=1 Tax=Hyphodiscus hymeniophilus TaxID=353542 RepID=A0A9P6VG33_9HELO|nr:Aldo-keto reductase dtxS3 [Hyphodiscus hymeniophilus]